MTSLISPTEWNSGLSQDNYALIVGGQDYWVENAADSYSLTAATSTALRFEVRAGDTWTYDPSTKNRSEIEAWTHYSPDTQINVSYGFQLEQGARNAAEWFVIGQFHDQSGTNSPPMSIQMFGERMAVVIRHDTSSGQVEIPLWTDSQDIVRGHTYNMQIHVLFDAHNNGHLVVTRDGATLVDYTGSIGYGSTSSVYWKEGIYRAADATTQAADFTDLLITTGAYTAPPPPTTAPPPVTDPLPPPPVVTPSDPTAPVFSVSTLSQTSTADKLKGWSDGGTITVSESGHLIATASVASTGAWAATFAANQKVAHTFLVTDTDAGNSSTMHVVVGTTKSETLTALGNGDFLVGDGGNDTYVLSANVTGTKLDAFRAGHDRIDFKGFDSASAHLTQLDTTHWQIADANHTDTFMVGNGAALHSSDYYFG